MGQESRIVRDKEVGGLKEEGGNDKRKMLDGEQWTTLALAALVGKDGPRVYP